MMFPKEVCVFGFCSRISRERKEGEKKKERREERRKGKKEERRE